MMKRALVALAFAAAPVLALAQQIPFRPVGGSTVSLSATTTSGTVTLTGITGTLPPGGGSIQLRLYNAGPVAVFILFGACSGLTATTSNMPIPSGAVEVFSLDVYTSAASCVAGITGSGTATLYVTTGKGV